MIVNALKQVLGREKFMSKANYLIISCSLNPQSNSRILASKAYELLKKTENVELLDLRQHALPICDGAEAYGHVSLPELSKKIKEAHCILMAVPIYNYDVSAAAKNLIELTGKAWSEKIVGFLCAAGGHSSYMSVMSVANSLMLDFRCVIIPRFVYADGSAFDNANITDDDIIRRVEELTQAAKRFSAIAVNTVTN
jgi:FMN reductase